MTETAYSYMQSFIYGSVVPRIEPNTLASLPVPILPKPSQQQIHDLIVEASALRVEANNLISNLVDRVNSLLRKEYGDFKKNNSCIRSIKKIKGLEKRFDAPYNAGLGRSIYDKITETKFVTLSSISEVFHPMLFGKKQLKGLETKGNPLYKSSSMMKMKPETDFWLSLKKTDVYSKLQVKEGWVLISRTGTVGNVVRINASMNNVFIDDHMIRVKPKQEYSGLVYIYLKSFYGQKLIEFQKYGSVQEVINSEYIERIPIPLRLFEKDVLDELNKNVASASSNIDKSIANENMAVNIIEKEIESWQK